MGKGRVIAMHGCDVRKSVRETPENETKYFYELSKDLIGDKDMSQLPDIWDLHKAMEGYELDCNQEQAHSFAIFYPLTGYLQLWHLFFVAGEWDNVGWLCFHQLNHHPATFFTYIRHWVRIADRILSLQSNDSELQDLRYMVREGRSRIFELITQLSSIAQAYSKLNDGNLELWEEAGLKRSKIQAGVLWKNIRVEWSGSKKFMNTLADLLRPIQKSGRLQDFIYFLKELTVQAPLLGLETLILRPEYVRT